MRCVALLWAFPTPPIVAIGAHEIMLAITKIVILNFEIALVENMVQKNRSRFPIAVLLTTLICSH